MADHPSRDQESICRHVCYDQWQRGGESTECPACNSVPAEIGRPNPHAFMPAEAQRLIQTQVTPENDPRHFHNQPQETAPNPSADVAQGALESSLAQGSNDASALSTAPPEASRSDMRNLGGASPQANEGTQHSGNRPRVTLRLATADIPQVIFFAFVTSNVPRRPPTQTSPSQILHIHAQQPVTFFGMESSPPPAVFPPAPPPAARSSTLADADTNHNTLQHQQVDGQQQHPQPQPQLAQARPQPANTPPHAAFPAGQIATILTSLFSPSNTVFGEAVNTLEALDDVITQLREQTQPGGAPPASQAALDRLRGNMKELDEQILGVNGPGGRSKCVICVEDMSVGDKAAALPCDHLFHGECVTPWLEQHNTCPVCRRPVEMEGEEGEVGNGVDAGATPHARHGQEARAETADGMDWS